MQMTEIEFGKAVPIEGYGPGYFRVAGQLLEAPLLVKSTGARSWGGLEDITTLTNFCKNIDVLFVGTGTKILPLPSVLLQKLGASGLGVDVMSSPSACRTYNVLLSEQRRVAVALMAVET